jgi:zinc transport system substrate-binding protein
MAKRLLFIILFLISAASSANSSEKLSVFVSIVPQKYFVQQIGKDMVDVKIMVKPGASPATYEPKPRQMAELSKAKLYFSIGVPFENAWLKKISAANPDMKVIHTDHGIEKIAMAEHHHDEKAHEDGDDDGHTGLDPHIWTAPILVKIQAETILMALQQAIPQYKNELQANYSLFVAQIDALDQELKQTLAGKSGLQFMVFHPSWGYFAKAYGLKQVPIELEGKNPKPAQLKELIMHAKEDGIKIVFVQPQFSTKSAKLVASEIEGQVAFADPLAENWMNNLRMIAENFRAVLK